MTTLAAPTQEEEIDDAARLYKQATWYKPGKSINEFHDSNAWIRILLGGRGSAKTTAVVAEAIRHGLHNAGAKILFVRKTESSQADSTIDTCNTVFRNMGELYAQTETSLFRTWNNGMTVRIPSLRAIEEYNRVKPTCRTKGELLSWMDTTGTKLCSFIEMRGLPDIATSESKLRGFECSMFVFIEADQIAYADFKLALACLRWKGADPATCDGNGFIRSACVILDTNPPSPSHWIAQLEETEKSKAEAEKEMRFWHISTYENEHNLPPNYIERQILLPYAKNPAMIERMLWGKYADAFDGNAVYYAFEPTLHVGEDLPFPEGANLVRSYDFGTNNNCVYSAYWGEEYTAADGSLALDEYWFVLMDQFLDSSDTDRQAATTIKNTTECFPFANDRTMCAGVLDWADPAGANSNYSTSKTESCQKIFATYGIYPGFDITERGIQNGTAIINRFLQKRDRNGNPCFRVDKKNANGTYRALSGEYRYPGKGEPGYGDNKPLKGTLCNFADSYADSLRYGMLNVLRLQNIPHEKTPPPNHHRKSGNPNPTREL